LGRQTTPELFNEQMFRDGTGLSNVRLGQPIGDASDRETYLSIRASSDSHPATTLLADFQRLDLDRARVYRRHDLVPNSVRGLSVLVQGSAGEPIVVERKLGNGRVL